jgi:hypothetical protein
MLPFGFLSVALGMCALGVSLPGLAVFIDKRRDLVMDSRGVFMRPGGALMGLATPFPMLTRYGLIRRHRSERTESSSSMVSARAPAG